MSVTVNKLDNNLEEQSFLQFWFPRGNRSFTKLTLPFFENIKIEENSSANYIEYNPQSRSGSFFSYTGSKSRAFSLSFNLTYPHLYTYALKNKFTVAPTVKSSEELRALFFQSPQDPGQDPGFTMKKGNAYDFFRDYGETDNQVEEAIKNFLAYQSGLSAQTGNAVVLDPTQTNQKINAIETKFIQDSQGSKVNRDIIDIILYWINIIRASILSNAEKPTLGPPIVRLNHGIMYQDVPCICVDYKISDDGERAGYDQKTMLPRSININMSLREHRVGDFKEYDIFDDIRRDNLAGWEAVLDGTHSLDPISRRFIGQSKLPDNGPQTNPMDWFN